MPKIICILTVLNFHTSQKKKKKMRKLSTSVERIELFDGIYHLVRALPS